MDVFLVLNVHLFDSSPNLLVLLFSSSGLSLSKSNMCQTPKTARAAAAIEQNDAAQPNLDPLARIKIAVRSLANVLHGILLPPQHLCNDMTSL